MGGYLGWVLKDDYKVFIDGRHYRMNRALATYRSIRRLRTGWDKALDSYEINTIVIPPKIIGGKLMPLLENLIDNPAWRLVVAEDSELLFLRERAIPGIPQHYQMDKSQVWSPIVESAKRKIEYFPKDHFTHVTLADALIQLGKYEQAIQALRTYLLLEPEDQEVAQRLAELVNSK